MKNGIDYIGVGIGAVIINKDKKIFLHKRGKKARNEKGKWGSPGGTLRFGETFEEAVKREMKEEFGVDIEPVDIFETFNHKIPDDKQHWVAIAFVYKIKKGKPKIMETDKCEKIGWFTMEEMEKMDLTIVGRKRLEQLKEKYPHDLPNLYLAAKLK